MEAYQLVDDRLRWLEAVLSQPLVKQFLACLLHLALPTSQNGLNLGFRLGRRDEIDP